MVIHKLTIDYTSDAIRYLLDAEDEPSPVMELWFEDYITMCIEMAGMPWRVMRSGVYSWEYTVEYRDEEVAHTPDRIPQRWDA